MRNLTETISSFAVAALSWLGASAARAQDFCADMRQVIEAAPTEFSALKGSSISDMQSASLLVFHGLKHIEGTGECAIGEQTSEGRRFSTSYTCANAAPDSAVGMASLTERLRTCLDVTEWTEQQDGRGARSAQYGLLRLSITRNGADGGLALGVESFRDEHGEVMGSPMRGDAVNSTGVHRCIPRSPEDITSMIASYAALPGAERFEDRQFVGYRNRTSHPTIAFVTKPTHPAHPALIVRDVTQRDGSTFLSAEGDFAGDCQAFQELLQQVIEMNQNVGH
ncbi:MAG: hypothetical protein HY054_06435 [Proteobacteria bacterium]|nr:hypothetical protein [Pseudomonadota bacterium]